ncbi:hypothetical protein E5288_WYG006770 [Bos mutus]|uniref:Uncharacterized protein n=1 Tax=Bos mutus TaxID=72004 RepID=A0A6B0RHL5_9CETA|nr:hypothetical protein [Bos mutus]
MANHSVDTGQDQDPLSKNLVLQKLVKAISPDYLHDKELLAGTKKKLRLMLQMELKKSPDCSERVVAGIGNQKGRYTATN